MNYILLLLRNIKLVIIISINNLNYKLKNLKSDISVYLNFNINIIPSSYYIKWLYTTYCYTNIVVIYLMLPSLFCIKVNIAIMYLLYTLLTNKIIQTYNIIDKAGFINYIYYVLHKH